MALRPPQYGADWPIVFVHDRDDAWDSERIKREQAEMRARDEDPTKHPVARYLVGRTRYHLDAAETLNGETVTVREYLDESKGPTYWHLRRLDLMEWYEVAPQWERSVRAGERPLACYRRCCELGLVRVENGPKLELPGGRPSRADMERLFALGQMIPADVGAAVYWASQPLTDAEGKPSG